jgi:hypothetical protein
MLLVTTIAEEKKGTRSARFLSLTTPLRYVVSKIKGVPK